MTIKQLKKQLLEMIENDFIENPYNWAEYLITTEIERLENEPVEVIAEFYSDDPEVVAESLDITVEELEDLLEKDTETLPDTISITWAVDDIKSMDDSLTDQECREVLQMAKRDHDATIGISWDVLQYHIDELKGEK